MSNARARFPWVFGLVLLGVLGFVAVRGTYQEFERNKRSPDRSRIRLATTTSTENSGLLDALLPTFTRETGYGVDVIAVGTGRALALGERGDADVVLVHAREREDAFLAAGHAVERRDVMYNDFVILGPPSDPARIRGMTDILAAMRKLEDAGARFVTRGDDSGTHIRERALWKAAGVEPTGLPEYVDVGAGMGRCLTIADEKSGYTLADRGTYLAFRARLDLEILVEGDDRLRNPYGVLLVNPKKNPKGDHRAAKALVAFLTSAQCHQLISDFRVGGEVLFHPLGAP
jgi:tungstate transport system substrate-binding protein